MVTVLCTQEFGLTIFLSSIKRFPTDLVALILRQLQTSARGVEALASLGARTDGSRSHSRGLWGQAVGPDQLILREEACMGLFAIGWKIGEAEADFLREQPHSCKS
ncbi:hypothetical protein MAXJ12_33264 [Mesorhizobium alhagi CCNWXJ12-2]|uniref:Uncharacterized protein n=1 Tax=Mesorhizobium alhagi CCNWXJ12-2 TaxID=1107882 RepID=H0I2F1_9HYPH|nr:hypothetical protein MAXJ12_33264 [Mesorhizobium alhagi CCNWXJ12-2]